METPAFSLLVNACHPRSPRRVTSKPLVCSQLSPKATPPSKATPPKTPPIFFVLGGPGSGKGTQCNFLKHDYDVRQICVGDLLRREASLGTSLGKTIEGIMQRGEIVPGNITMGLLKDELTRLVGTCEGVLIDGFPRAMDQANNFENMVTACKLVLYFHCETPVMMERLLNRGRTSGRADDVEAVVLKRLNTFEQKTLPVVEHFRKRGLLREIDSSTGTPEQVYEETRTVFNEAFS